MDQDTLTALEQLAFARLQPLVRTVSSLQSDLIRVTSSEDDTISALAGHMFLANLPKLSRQLAALEADPALQQLHLALTLSRLHVDLGQ